MSLEFDKASTIRPLLGTAAAQNTDGTVFTPAVDTDLYGAHSLTFVAIISAAVNYSAAAWVVKESDDNSVWTDVDAEKVIFPKPSTGSSRAFHAGTVSKKRYVKAAFNSGGAETGQVTPILGHLQSQPTFTS